MADAAVNNDVRVNIALRVCRSFIDQEKPVSRRELLLEYGNRDLLDEMSTRGLLRENPNNRDCLPTAGSFALLGDEHGLYLQARDAFAQMMSVLWRFYRLEHGQEQYEDEALWKSLAELPDPRVEMTREVFDLGLYLCEQFSVFATWRHNAEHTKIEMFRLAELMASMREPMDGYRAIAFTSGGGVHLRSRNDNDFNGRYPGIVKALASMPDETVIDGEVVALDPEGRPSFNTIQNYGSSGARLHFFIFDLLVLKGKDVMAEPLMKRRELGRVHTIRTKSW
jgi:hypothetical protein